jgi:hypothetical protein
MPPVLPDLRYKNGHLYYLFRREFVRKYPIPLCSDAFSGFVQKDKRMHEYNSEVKKATQYLLESVIPKSAQKLFEVSVLILFDFDLFPLLVVFSCCFLLLFSLVVLFSSRRSNFFLLLSLVLSTSYISLSLVLPNGGFSPQF